NSLISEATPNTERYSVTHKTTEQMNKEQYASGDEADPIVIQVDMQTNQLSNTAPELIVEFTSEEDLTDIEPKVEQSLVFTDQNNNEMTLDFDLDSHSLQNGTLEVVYLLNGQALGNLTMKELQEIVIEDIVIN
ncbi:MAG: hypothetical protein AAFV25_25785, partial [Bacteroidota bacterium]